MHNAGLIHNGRRRLGMSQSALAEKVGCSKSSIINWEKGGTPLAVYRSKLEKILGISLKEDDNAAARNEDAPRRGR